MEKFVEKAPLPVQDGVWKKLWVNHMVKKLWVDHLVKKLWVDHVISHKIQLLLFKSNLLFGCLFLVLNLLLQHVYKSICIISRVWTEGD